MEAARYLPPLMAERLKSATKVELIREYTAIFLAEMLSNPAGTKQVHSKYAERTVGPRLYREYLRVMSIFCDRDQHYIPYKVNPDLARSKVWILKPFWRAEHKRLPWWSWVPIFVSKCLSRMRSAWLWFQDVWVRSVRQCDAVADAIAWSLPLVDLPDFVEYGMDSFCGGDAERSDANLRIANELRDNLSPECVLFDAGGRAYHSLTNLKRECRLRVTLAGEDVADVDLHATFVYCIADQFATGDEKWRLLSMLAGGDFYGEFARVAGVSLDRSVVKSRFQRDVVFIFKPHNELWDAWQKLFPVTASAMSKFRDWGEVVHVRRKVNCLGRSFLARTRRGQVAMSRRLSRLESDCFLSGALLDLASRGIPAVPIHDCLIVRERDVDAAREAISAAWRRRCGFDVVLKVKRWDDQYRLAAGEKKTPEE